MAGWDAAQLAALEKAIAAGVTRVEYGGQVTAYRSLAEMIATRDLIRRDLGLVPATTPARYSFTSHRRG